jgi:hypothetical protein
VRNDRAVRILLLVIAVSLAAIALRPYIAPAPVFAQNGCSRPSRDTANQREWKTPDISVFLRSITTFPINWRLRPAPAVASSPARCKWDIQRGANLASISARHR